MITKSWNTGWRFTKDAVSLASGDRALARGSWDVLDLPHTWNGEDGQDGGNDYHRGTCYYGKTLSRNDCPRDKDVYIEFEGANSTAALYVNGNMIARHDGGYSTWRCKLSKHLTDHNEMIVAVDNAPNDSVYPQMADFTFYGGLYRDVNLLFVNQTRFDLDNHGSPGIAVIPLVKGKDAIVGIQAGLTGSTGNETVHYVIFDGNRVVAEAVSLDGQAELSISNVRLWQGNKDPHLYTLRAQLMRDGEVLDERSVRFGCRSFSIDPDKGFILNGESYPLRGVSRHQDRPHKGNALSRADHEEDLALIMEMGANTIRLAHYQHDQYFLDLCDEKGLVVWAEIPYITKHLQGGVDNTVSQMTELILQNFNHPSIVVWGLSNEITMNSDEGSGLIENHQILNDLAHELDPNRLTTLAAVSPCDIDSAYLQIPDVVSYNHYYGWYGGDASMNGPFFDHFHDRYPNIPIGMSEYGCEALDWHNSKPEQGDYSEEYQAYYHEELIKQLFTRPFIWATHV